MLCIYFLTLVASRWKIHMKCRSISFFTFISDGSAVFFDDPFANTETKSLAAFLS